MHNLNIAENSAAADALALKKKGKQAGQYTGYDDEEFVEGGADAKASVLKKYDEEIEGKQESGFRLGGTVPAGGKGKGRARQNSEEKEEKERVVLSMDYTSSSPLALRHSLLMITLRVETFTTDYFVEGEVGFKKPKVSHELIHSPLPYLSSLCAIGEEEEASDKGRHGAVRQRRIHSSACRSIDSRANQPRRSESGRR